MSLVLDRLTQIARSVNTARNSLNRTHNNQLEAVNQLTSVIGQQCAARSNESMRVLKRAIEEVQGALGGVQSIQTEELMAQLERDLMPALQELAINIDDSIRRSNGPIEVSE